MKVYMISIMVMVLIIFGLVIEEMLRVDSIEDKIDYIIREHK